ncbi:DegV family protein [Paenibacillus spongiae]|uniref:DegV family protein n=1 Tax=Paenibacillus spongiae TaxID=2909671 RepID=A0ABY5S773_9BACL|nr:DegV family protein [Paenibacillus spongiae]UVI28563.1 DegV family protein [Paenibacillus spongiae]
MYQGEVWVITIRIVTDTTAELSPFIIDQYNITVIPLQVTLNEETFTESSDISTLSFINKMKASKKLPLTSQPSIGTFLETYDRLGENGDAILSIHMTGDMSGTYATASSAAAMSAANVETFDSRMMSQALGFQVIEAAQMASQGATIAEIKDRLAKIIQQTSLFVVVDSLEHLAKGGRIGRGQELLGSILNIKPIAMLQDGVYTPVYKVRTRSQLIKKLIGRFEEETSGRTIRGVGISHADNPSLAEELKHEIEKASGYTSTWIKLTTPVISSHTGPSAIGFSYYTD